MAQINPVQQDLLRYAGDLGQIFGVRDATLNGGKAQGVRVLDVDNGSGLTFSVLPDRGLDIARLSWQGLNMSHLAKSGIVAPTYFRGSGLDFLRSFYAGFLTTCGLRNVGAPCVDGGEDFGLHGTIAHVPAEEVSAGTDWSGEQPAVRISGQMREARLFGENLRLHREITSVYRENKLRIVDRVENLGFREEPLMLLYHFNLGYPLLAADAEVVAPVNSSLTRNQQSAAGLADCLHCQPPTPGYAEQVFDHDLAADAAGMTCAGLLNIALGVGVIIRFNKNELFNLTHWKMMGEGDYVVGLEPGNCLGGGRAEVRKSGRLEVLAPGEVRSFHLEIEFLAGADTLHEFRSEVEMLLKGSS